MTRQPPASASPTSFGELLFALRTQCRVSQTEVAQRAGISKGYLSGVENCRLRPPVLDTVRRLANALRLDASARAQLERLAQYDRRSPVVIPPTVPDHVFELATSLKRRANVIDEETAREMQSVLQKEA